MSASQVAPISSPRGTDLPVRLAVVALTVLGFVLRATCRPERSYWFDEAITISLARASWKDLWAAFTVSEANGALYTLVLRAWLHGAHALGATDELLAGRLLSAAVGAAAIPVAHAVASRLLGRGAGLLAAALLTVNQFHAFYSAEARTYALAALLALTTSWLFLRALESPGWRRWSTYALVAALSGYAHFFCGLVVAAQLVAAPSYPGDAVTRRRRWRYLVATSAVILLLVSPLLAFVVHGDRSQTAWIPRPSLDAIAQLVLAAAGRVRSVGPLRLGRALLVIVELPLVLLAVIGGLRGRAEDPARRWSTGYLLCWLVVPVGLALLLSLDRPIFVTRYLLVVVPAWTTLVAAGIVRLGRRGAVLGASAATLLLSLSGTLQPRSDDPPADLPFREAAQLVLSSARASDGLAFSHPAGAVPFDYYRRRLGAPPLAVELPPGGRWLGGPPDDERSAEARLRRHDRVWFVLFAESDGSASLRAALAPDFAEAVELDRLGVRVLRYDRRTPRAAAGAP